MEAVIDIKQEELDKAFLDGAIAAHDAVVRALSGDISQQQEDRLLTAIFDMLVKKIGSERIHAIDYKYEGVPQA